jgi:hypothetical protein
MIKILQKMGGIAAIGHFTTLVVGAVGVITIIPGLTDRFSVFGLGQII